MLTSILYSLSSLHQSMKGDIRKNKRYCVIYFRPKSGSSQPQSREESRTNSPSSVSPQPSSTGGASNPCGDDSEGVVVLNTQDLDQSSESDIQVCCRERIMDVYLIYLPAIVAQYLAHPLVAGEVIGLNLGSTPRHN